MSAKIYKLLAKLMLLILKLYLLVGLHTCEKQISYSLTRFLLDNIYNELLEYIDICTEPACSSSNSQCVHISCVSSNRFANVIIPADLTEFGARHDLYNLFEDCMGLQFSSLGTNLRHSCDTLSVLFQNAESLRVLMHRELKSSLGICMDVVRSCKYYLALF